MTLEHFFKGSEELSDIVKNSPILSKKASKTYCFEDDVIEKYEESKFKDIINEEIIDKLYDLIPFMSSPRYLGIKIIQNSLQFENEYDELSEEMQEKYIKELSKHLDKQKEILYNNMRIITLNSNGLIDKEYSEKILNEPDFCSIIHFRKQIGFRLTEIDEKEITSFNNELKEDIKYKFKDEIKALKERYI